MPLTLPALQLSGSCVGRVGGERVVSLRETLFRLPVPRSGVLTVSTQLQQLGTAGVLHPRRQALEPASVPCRAADPGEGGRGRMLVSASTS